MTLPKRTNLTTADLELNEDLIARLGMDMEKYGAFKSDTEAAFHAEGRIALQNALGCPVFTILYEWMSFNVPSSTYTPDFAVLLMDGRLVFVEVKGSKKQIHYKITRNKVRIVASLNPWFAFCIATPVPRVKHTWDIDIISPEPKLGAFLVHLTTKGDTNGNNDQTN